MTPIKDDLAILAAQLSANARVDLFDKNYLHRIKWIFPSLLMTALISLSALFTFGMLSQAQLIVSSFIAIGVLLLVQFVVRRARVAALKGDTIILKGINSKSTVTSIKSVRCASTRQIFGVQVTRLEYTLDHQKQSSFVFGGPAGMKTTLDQLIQHAKKCRKKIKGKS